jgi:hypothetical protein
MAFSRPHYKHGEMLVWAAKSDASVMYFVPATVRATTIDGNLEALGRISVTFEAVGAPEKPDTGCDQGDKVPFQPGSWVGTIALAGEEGFTRVRETHAKAIVNPFIEAVCGGAVSIGELTGHGIRGARLVARSTNSEHALFLQVNKNHRNAPVRVEASLEERRGRLLVNRDVVHRYSSGSFSFDPLMRASTLNPSAPFSGSATFHRNAKPANRWAGNLSVDFPGRADVPLAGGRFHAALVHATRTEEKTQRDRFSRPALFPWLPKPAPAAWVEVGADQAISLAPTAR